MNGTARIVITGVGVVTPLGDTLPALWQALCTGQSAARDWPDLAAEGYRSARACRIADFECDPLRRGRTLAITAAERACRHANVHLPADSGVFVGSTLGESLAFERAAEGEAINVADYGVPSFTAGIRERLGVSGPQQSLATACAAGNYAVGAALTALQTGRCDMALAGGVEPFSRLSMVGFSRSRAMASDGCRPFDAKRTGMLLGEGAALFVMESAAHALQRGATPLAEVVTLGLSCDAHHPTAPQPQGLGMRAAMQAALDQAGIAPTDVDWVNAHGSGTRASDAAEAKALHALFAETMPAVSGSKGALGHALGAASAIEVAVCVAALQAQTVPPTAGHEQPEAEDGIACTRAAAPRRLDWIMNNAFAFGGLNSALLLRVGCLMRIDACRSLTFDALLEREAMARVADGLAPLFDTETPRERPALIVVSDNAGSATSLRFWSDAVRTGVDVASPELFPWCLANAPCGALSRHFGVTGPNMTLLGDGDALLSAWDTAAQDLASHRVAAAVVIVLSFGSAATGGRALGLRTAASNGETQQTMRLVLDVLSGKPLRTAMDLLQQWLTPAMSPQEALHF